MRMIKTKPKIFAIIAVIAVSIIAAGVAVAATATSHGTGAQAFRAFPSGEQQVPEVVGAPGGHFKIRFRANMSAANFRLRVADPSPDTIVAAHIHCAPAGDNGSVVVDLLGPFGTGAPFGLIANGLILNANVVDPGTCGRSINNVASLAQAAAEGILYVNVHSTSFGGGLTRGQIVE